VHLCESKVCEDCFLIYNLTVFEYIEWFMALLKGLTDGTINKHYQTVKTRWLAKYSLNELWALKFLPALDPIQRSKNDYARDPARTIKSLVKS